ncbi:mobile mystery protein B [Dyadobacter jiangsuensis]
MIYFQYPPGATPLTPEELDDLKLKHITTRGELDRWEQENIQEAHAWLNRLKRRDIVSEEFICTLHNKMFSKVWNWSGRFRRTDKNIGVAWHAVPTELRRLVDDTNAWIEFQSYSPDEIAYRFHHRLVWIHLFPNGNGRHSRLMADIILTKLLGQDAFTWGSDDLTRASDVRTDYIQALRAADNNDYDLLNNFVRS